MNARDFSHTDLAAAFEELAAMPAFVAAALAEGGEAIRTRPREGEFSLLEQACHLRDLEREGYLVRARRMLAEDRPELEPFDGAAVAASRNYHAEDPQAAARDFARARRELLELLTPLGTAQLAREGVFEGRRICVTDLVAMIAAHDHGHREEIEQLIDELEAP